MDLQVIPAAYMRKMALGSNPRTKQPFGYQDNPGRYELDPATQTMTNPEAILPGQAQSQQPQPQPQPQQAQPSSSKPGQAAIQALAKMYQSFEKFRNTFNPEMQLIDAAKQQILAAWKSLKTIDWGSSVVDEQQIVQQASAVQQLLDRATQEESQDLSFIQQLSTQMAQLGQMVGQRTGAASGEKIPATTPTSTPTTQNTTPKKPGIWQGVKNLGRGIGNAWRGQQPATASTRITLTACMGSALYSPNKKTTDFSLV